MEDQLEIMEANFTKTYIEYPDPLELELDNEKDEEVHGEISDESMDESVIYFEEVKEFEFESVEYLDNSSPHPPPEELIFFKDNFENLEENNMMVPVICSFSTSQPRDELMQNCEEMEGNFSLSSSYHYEYWLTFHLDSHMQQSIKILHGLSNSHVWLNRVLTAYSTRGSTPCTMKICIIRCKYVEDYLVLLGNLCLQHIFL
jgi:hypothetical protein